MDKYLIPIVVVLGIGAYLLIGEQFKKIREAPPPELQANPLGLPNAQPLQPVQIPQFNSPFAKQGPPPEPAADDFTPVTFDDPHKKFRVAFPGRTPTHDMLPSPDPKLRVVVTRYAVPKPGTMFEIDEYDSGWDAVKRRGAAREWLKKCYRNQLDGIHANETMAKDITVHETIPGIEFEALYTKDEKTQVWAGRMYLVGSRLYSVSVYGDPSIVSLQAPAFLGSFELSPPKGAKTPIDNRKFD
jgi:hypothetical protein